MLNIASQEGWSKHNCFYCCFLGIKSMILEITLALYRL